MKNWEKALNKFIRPYLKHQDVQGILLCGSYAGGYETPQSDIDVHIIYDDANAAMYR